MGNTSTVTPMKAGSNPIAVTPELHPPQAQVIHERDSKEIASQVAAEVTVPQDTRTKHDLKDAELAAYMMYSQRSAPVELPELQTEAWPHEGQRPNPISISKARQLLAAAYSAVPCEMPGAGVHGHRHGSLRLMRTGPPGKGYKEPLQPLPCQSRAMSTH